MQITNVRENIDKIEFDDREVYLIGTAHVSHASAALVEETIRELRPDTVAVELCAPRFESLQNPDRWKNTNIVEVVRSGKSYVLLSQLMLVGFQKKLGEKLKIKPGEEMLRAIAVAKEVGSEIVMADREVRITLKRSWAGLSFYGMSQILVAMVLGLFSKQDVTESEIERLKSADALDEALKEFAEIMPQVRKALIDERDLYMASKIKESRGKRIVAVVGAGHVPGIKAHFGEDIDRVALEKIPPRSWGRTIVNWGVPILLSLLILRLMSGSGSTEEGYDKLTSYALISGGSAALGALLTLSHPISIMVAFAVGPLTPFLPFLKSGKAAALSEALIRKPRVSDFETIADDMGSLRGLYGNRVSHILLVLVVTSLFNWIGIFAGAKILASISA